MEKFISVVKEIFQTFVVSLVIFLAVYIFLVQPHRIRGDSMLPNFHDNELLLTEKISYRFGEPKRGDVIVFKAPGNRNVDFIKRIVGVPGDTLNIQDGSVFVNGTELLEPYETQKTQGFTEVKLENGEYFVLGDNRGSSSDSRSFGPIQDDSIKGRVWLVYWPVLDGNNSEGLRKISRIDYSVTDGLDNR